MGIRSGIVPNHIVLFEKYIVNLDSILVAVSVNQSTLRSHPKEAIVPKVTVDKGRNKLCRRIRSIIVIQHDGNRRLNKVTKLAIAKGNRSRLVDQECVISGPDKGKSLQNHVFDSLVTNAQHLGPIHVQVTSTNPASIVPQTLISTFERHVGPKGNWRIHGSRIWLNDIAIEIQISNIKNVPRADNVSTRKRSVLDHFFPFVNIVQVINAGLSMGGRCQEQEAEDRREQTKTRNHGKLVVDRALHCCLVNCNSETDSQSTRSSLYNLTN